MTALFPDPQMMPPEAPLEMPVQDLGVAPGAAPLPWDGFGVLFARIFVFGTAAGVAGALSWVMQDWFAMGGIAWAEAAIIACGAFTAFWIALSVPTALLGCLPRRSSHASGEAMDIAILLPIYG